MAISLILNEEQQNLSDELERLVEEINTFYATDVENYGEQELRYEKIAKKAHDLHMSLKEDGHEPKHHAYMYRNRGLPVEDPEFYKHIHPVEDLLAFIHDPDANDDPEDRTMGLEFQVAIYTNRWGHHDTYCFVRTSDGWKITRDPSFKDKLAGKDGSSALFDALNHDAVCYPAQIDRVLENIWEQGSKGASEEEIQQQLSEFGEWISICEKTRPQSSWGI